MLRQENFSEEHIRELQRTSRRDPVLLERTVYAFGLLEALAKVDMPFVFKGGTSLINGSERITLKNGTLSSHMIPLSMADHFIFF